MKTKGTAHSNMAETAGSPLRGKVEYIAGFGPYVEPTPFDELSRDEQDALLRDAGIITATGRLTKRWREGTHWGPGLSPSDFPGGKSPVRPLAKAKSAKAK